MAENSEAYQSAIKLYLDTDKYFKTKFFRYMGYNQDKPMKKKMKIEQKCEMYAKEYTFWLLEEILVENKQEIKNAEKVCKQAFIYEAKIKTLKFIKNNFNLEQQQEIIKYANRLVKQCTLSK